MTRSRRQTLVAEVERIQLRLEGKRSHTQALLKDWEKWAPSTHHLPIPWVASLSIGQQLSLLGYPRLGALHILQAETGLRPGELLQLFREDLVPAWMSTARPAVCTLALGTRASTKRRRQQFVIIRTDEQPIAAVIVAALYATTAPGTRLSSIRSLSHYNELLKRAMGILSILHLGLTAHGARAGWATRMRLRGLPFEELRERGRWESARSLRIYLDVVGANDLAPSVTHLQGMGRWIEEDFANRFHWWRGVPPNILAHMASNGRDLGPNM